MKAIEVKNYKRDQNSKYVYLGQVKVKAIEFQHTEDKNQWKLELGKLLKGESNGSASGTKN